MNFNSKISPLSSRFFFFFSSFVLRILYVLILYLRPSIPFFSFVSPMEVLSASSILCCRSSLNKAADHSCLSLSSVRQLGFPLILKHRNKCTSRPLSISVVNASQDGSSSAVEDDKKGLFLGPQRDASGSVVGFHLMPHSDRKSFLLLHFYLICYECFQVFFFVTLLVNLLKMFCFLYCIK